MTNNVSNPSKFYVACYLMVINFLVLLVVCLTGTGVLVVGIGIGLMPMIAYDFWKDDKKMLSLVFFLVALFLEPFICYGLIDQVSNPHFGDENTANCLTMLIGIIVSNIGLAVFAVSRPKR